MKYIESLKKYAEHRTGKINEKKQSLKDLQEQLTAKRDDVKKLENEYKQTFAEKTYDSLFKAKTDADNIQGNIRKVSEIINLMDEGNFQYDAAALEKEIDEYISGLELEKLKEQILKAKDAYISSLNIFEKTLDDIARVKTSIGQYVKYTDRQTRQNIINYLTKHSKEYCIEDEQLVNNINHENLIRSIRGKAPSIYIDNYFIKGDN